jgi:hypothetical protein
MFLTISRFILHQYVSIFLIIRMCWTPKSRLVEHTLIHAVIEQISFNIFMIFLFFNRKLFKQIPIVIIYLRLYGRIILTIFKNLVNSSILCSKIIEVGTVYLYV